MNNYNWPLHTPKNREYNLYLANYRAHEAKKKLKILIKSENIEPCISEKLIEIVNNFPILNDIEKKEND
jgi:hypothetical protein